MPGHFIRWCSHCAGRSCCTDSASPLLIRTHVQFVPCTGSSSPTSNYRNRAWKRS